MSAITIPQDGELNVGPFVQKIAKVTFGTAATNDVVASAQTTYALFNIPANCLVLEVLAYTHTAWTTSVTMNIGDGTDTDGFLATAKIAPTSAQTNGIVKSTAAATAEAFAGGKLYTSADTIDAVIGGATPVVGQTDVYIKYIENVSAL